MSSLYEYIREKYHDLFEYSLDLLYFHDLKGNFIDANEITLSKLGYKKEEISDLSFFQLLDKEQINKAFEVITEIRDKGKQLTPSQYRIKKKDGEDFYIETYAIPVKKEDEIIGILGIGKDLTEIMESQKRLKQSEEKYRLIVENQTDLIAKLDVNGKFVYASPTYIDIFKIDDVKRLDNLYTNFIHPDDKKATIKQLRKIFHPPYRIHHENRMLTQEGYRWYSWIDHAILDEKGRIKNFLTVGRDITSLKETEAKLKKSEEKYRLIVENQTDYMYVLDKNGIYTFVSPSYTELFDRKQGDLFQPKVNERVEKEDLRRMRKVWRKIFKPPHQTTYEHHILSNKGWRWISWKNKALFNEQGKIDAFLSVGRDITELKEAEQKLKYSETKYRNLFEDSPLILVLLDTTGKIIEINPAALQNYGLTEDEFLGKNFADLIYYSGDQLRVLVHEFKNLFKYGSLGPLELEITRADNMTIWISVQATLLEIEAEGFIQVIVQDITVKKEAEQQLAEHKRFLEQFNKELEEKIALRTEELRKSEEKFRHLFEHAPYCIILLNQAGNIIDCNAPTEKIFHLPKEEILGHTMADFGLKSFNDLLLFSTSFTKVLGDDFPEGFEYQIVEENGTIQWLKVQETLISWKDELYVQVIIEDITARKKAEEKQSQSEQKYKALIESSPNSVILMDYTGTVLECNEVATIFIGLTKKEIIHNNIYELFGFIPEERKDAPNKIKIGEIFFPIEFKFINKRGVKMNLSSNFSMIRLGDEIFIQIVSQEISARKEAEELIIRELDKLRKLDEIKNEFVYRASHELKTPLNSLNVATNTLIKYYDALLDDNAKKLLTTIRNGGLRLKILVEELVDVARIESRQIELERKREDVSKIIKDCLQDLSFLITERGQALKVDIQEDIFLNIDKMRFEQVIMNLISNAIKNTPPGGKLTVEAKKTELNLDVKITDTGVGITEQEKEIIFKKFGKIERHGKEMNVDIEGSGLGLFITKEIIELHGGEIWAESEGRDKGATFHLRLPL